MTGRGLLRIFLVAGLGLYGLAQILPENTALKLAERERSEREAARRRQKAEEDERVALKDVRWRQGGFGTVAIVSFAVANGNSFDIKDVVLRCSFFGNSGTALGVASNTVYETVAKNATRRVRDLNLGYSHSQAGSASCEIAGYVKM